MDWNTILKRAEKKAGGGRALARLMEVSPNTPRQWRFTISLPEPQREALLAELAGVTPEEVKEAIWQARLDRIKRRGDPPSNGPQSGEWGPPRKPLAAVTVSVPPALRRTPRLMAAHA